MARHSRLPAYRLPALLLACCCFVSLLAKTARAADSARKPNVILFLVDDMGYMDCGAYGSKYYETPNMDRFATKAMRFTDAYAQPLCSPTRASILSGQYATRHQLTTASGHTPPQPEGFQNMPDSASPTKPVISPVSKNVLEPSQITLAETLHAAGYRTAHIGKWHLGLTRPYWPEQQGFDVAFHCHPDPGPPGGYFSPYGVVPDGEPGGKVKVGTITDGPKGEYIVDRLTDEAIKFMDASKDKPFFLNLWQYGVHGPWGHKESYTREFAKKTDPRGVQGNPIMASMLKSVDESLGRIMAEVDRLGIADNTIIIFNSDNGGNVHSNVPGTDKTQQAEESFPAALADWRKWAGDKPPTNNAPLRAGKGTLYEGGTRVPLMWQWAGHIKPGTTNTSVVGHIDLYPTILDLAGVARPKEQILDGVSYASVLTAGATLDRKAFFDYFPHAENSGGIWVRSGDFKLIRWFDPGVPPELYNLHDDIGESKNLAQQLPDKLKELNGLIDQHLKDTAKFYPKPNPAYDPKLKPAGDKKKNKAAKGAADAAGGGADLQGWVPKGITATTADGGIELEGGGKNPFIAMTKLGMPGPCTVTIRLKTRAGGDGQVQYRKSDQPDFPGTGQTVAFKVKPSADWQDVRVELPVDGELMHVRLSLPMELPVEVQTIQISGKGKSPKTWDFAKQEKASGKVKKKKSAE